MSYAIVEMAPYLGCDFTYDDNRGCLRPQHEHQPNDRGFPVILHHAFVPFTRDDRIVRVVRALTADEVKALL